LEKLETIAREIAVKAQQEQLDKAEQPCITHPEFGVGS
jgi:hypothetical protein